MTGQGKPKREKREKRGLVGFIGDALLKRNPTMKTILTNWKTTITGIGMIAGGIAAIARTLSDGWGDGDMNLITTAIGAVGGGFGLIFARDGDKSSQDSGVRS